MKAWYKVSNLEFRDPKDFLKSYGSLGGENLTRLVVSIVFDFFDGVAVLLQKGLADIGLIYDRAH